MDSAIRDEVIAELDTLSEDQQREVLEFVRSVKDGIGPGTPGKEFLRFAGSLPLDDAEEMLRIIEEGREKVDPDERRGRRL